jgi:hypothetical protein
MKTLRQEAADPPLRFIGLLRASLVRTKVLDESCMRHHRTSINSKLLGDDQLYCIPNVSWVASRVPSRKRIVIYRDKVCNEITNC